MEHMEQIEQMEQIESEYSPQGVTETQNKDIDLSASAPNHAPTSEFGAQTLLAQPVQEAPDFNNQSERALNLEMDLIQGKAPNGEEASLVNNVHLRHSTLHSNGDSLPDPNYGVDYAYGVGLHAGQMDTTLPRYEPYQHTLLSNGDPGPGQFMTQQEDIDPEVPRIQAYAKLEFDDGEFYMNTYSVELGRDLEAARLASEWEQEESQFASLKRRRTSTSSEDGSQISNLTMREDERHNASSVISDIGGIIGPDTQESHKRKKPRFSKSKSATSSSQQLSRKSSMDLQNAPRAGQSPVMASLIDASILHHADPEACPLIRIHPPATGQGVPASHKGISRRHVKIAFNFEKHVFELTILGRNGAFVDELWYRGGETLALKNGSLIQIGGVRVRFLLPDMSSGEGGVEAANPLPSSPVDSVENFEYNDVRILEHKLHKHGLKLVDSPYGSSYVYSSSEDDEPRGGDQLDPNRDAASLSADESHEAEGVEAEGMEAEDDEADSLIESPQDEDTSELEELEAKPSPISARAKRNGKSKASVKQVKKSGTKALAKTKLQLEPLSNQGSVPEPTAPVVKRKGPGRPPKNGIMSKREQKLLAKQAQEAAKATEQPFSEEKVMDTNQDDIPAPPPVPTKRKYTKRKPKDLQPEQDPASESPEHTRSRSPRRRASEAQPKAPKEKKPARPPRSPSPVYDRSTMTKEQLLRPNASYLLLIHEVLTNAPPEGMGLPQIYRAIERKYPFFKIEVTTVGWQSSVRHNLSQHDMFLRLKREGKGWLWALNPEVPLEKEKKRRVVSPPRSAQHAPPPHHPQMMPVPENYQQPHMMHAPHNFPQPYPMQPHHQDYPPASMIPNPYRYPGGPTPNGHHFAHNNAYAQFKPAGQIPYPQPGSSHQGIAGSSYQGVFGPNGLPLPLLNGVTDSSSTYQSPYQPAPPIRPPQQAPLQQQTSMPLINGFDGAHDSGTVEPAPPPPPPPPPPPSASETPTNQLPAAPSLSSLVHQTQPQGPVPPAPGPPGPGPAPNTSQEILQAISQFKTYLVSSMKDHKHGEALVTSAINRVLGYQTSSSLPGNEEDPQEKTIMQIFSGMLEDLNKKSNNKPQQQPCQPPPSQTNSQPGHVPWAAAVASSSSSSSSPPPRQPASAPAQLTQLLHHIDPRQPGSSNNSESSNQQHHQPLSSTPNHHAPNPNPNPSPDYSSSPSDHVATKPPPPITKPKTQHTPPPQSLPVNVITPPTPPEPETELDGPHGEQRKEESI